MSLWLDPKLIASIFMESEQYYNKPPKKVTELLTNDMQFQK